MVIVTLQSLFIYIKPQPLENACYVRITMDHGSLSMIFQSYFIAYPHSITLRGKTAANSIVVT